MIRQIDYLKDKYGRVAGDINTTGVQNLALKIRGDQLYVDFFQRPELCHHLLKICAECVIQLFQFNQKTTGTGAVDVTPMCDPKLFVIPNCTAEQISLKTYEDFILPYDNQVADACHPLGIHHCGSVNEVLDGCARVHHLAFVEIGFGSDVKKAKTGIWTARCRQRPHQSRADEKRHGGGSGRRGAQTDRPGGSA